MELTFQLGNELIKVRIEGANLTFANSQTNFTQFVPIEGLSLSKEGILKEHPDLKGKPDGEIRQEAIKRFKKHIKKLKENQKIRDYIIEDLKKHGFVLISEQRKGFRIKK